MDPIGDTHRNPSYPSQSYHYAINFWPWETRRWLITHHKTETLTLPETKKSHLKLDVWNTIVSFWGPALFSGALLVSVSIFLMVWYRFQKSGVYQLRLAVFVIIDKVFDTSKWRWTVALSGGLGFLWLPTSKLMLSGESHAMASMAHYSFNRKVT